MPNDPKGYYARLGLSPDANTEDIKAAYRRLVKVAHPDANPSVDNGDFRFRELNEAYGVLNNAEKRAAYDALSSPKLPSIVSAQGNFDPFAEIKISTADSKAWTPTRSEKAGNRKLFKWLGVSVALATVGVIGFVLALPFLGPSPKSFSSGMKFTDCANCPRMTVIPSGSFIMGQPDASTGGQPGFASPPHLVSLPRMFAVGSFLATNGEYAEFLSAAVQQGSYDQRWAQTDQDGGGRHLLWRLREVLSEAGYQTHPVTYVSWAGAQAYVRWLSEKTGQRYRLLSEAEWEYAARGGTQTTFYFGNDLEQICEYANVPDMTRRQHHPNAAVVTCTDGYSESAPVGKFKPNAFGLYDMIGNVWEWVEDCWHNDYYGAPSDGKVWLSEGGCSNRVIRGQSYEFLDYGAGIAARLSSAAYGSLPTIGFRVARDIVP